MQKLPTGTVTFLFSDIETSTKLWQDQPDSMRPALARHDQLLREAITENGGYVFKTVGDGFCAAFATAHQALAGALAAQRALTAELWVTNVPLRVRMALHTGSAEERDGDYYGQVLNRVARLTAVGHGGQILLSAAAQELTRDLLPPSASLIDLGRRRLQDLGRPEQVFQLVHPILRRDFPPLATLDNPAMPNNLPPQLTTFVGRRQGIAEIKALLQNTRLVTLTGAGGVGKSRLSLQVAADLLEVWEDGVWLVELGLVLSPTLLPSAITEALGVRQESGRAPAVALIERLQARRLLLVLDNCEHLTASCAALITNLLRTCTDLRVLATSREPLGVVGEQTYRVSSLSLPSINRQMTAGGVAASEAVRLFAERAALVQPSFAVTDANALTVAELCLQLDGLPLAIELAAARVRSMPLSEIGAHLDARCRLLTGGTSCVLPRHQALTAAMDWSYELLSPLEQQLFRCLSVFVGGWTLTAAETVCSGDDADTVRIVESLTGLVDKSLVLFQEDGKERYRMLETLRSYAASRLAESGEQDRLRNQHLTWCLSLAQEAEPHLRGAGRADWLDRLEIERDNLRTALATSQSGELASFDADRSMSHGGSALELASAIWRFWWQRGGFLEGWHWLEGALAATDSIENDDAAWQRLRAKALSATGCLARESGDYEAADRRFAEALAIRSSLGDEQIAALILMDMGGSAMYQGQIGVARDLFEAALATFRTSDNSQRVAGALTNLGTLNYFDGNYKAAREHHLESLDTFHKLKDEWSVCLTLCNLARTACREGDQEQAHMWLVEAAAYQERLRDKRMAVCLAENKALFAAIMGDATESARLLGSAEAMREQTGLALPPVERSENEQLHGTLRDVLGKTVFDAAYLAGKDTDTDLWNVSALI